jgi:spore cortex formation protein SpoVR/YcgB (stage V sporulation)
MGDMNKEEIKQMLSKSEWTEETIFTFSEIIDRISIEHLGLDVYPNQFEIVSSEQLLDCYALIGLPISYNHWKFGKEYVINQNNYKKGRMGLSYEMVINTDACISYNLEDNDTCLMTLVYAHVQGHNHFFKNNYLFKLWTQADAIIDYMLFARDYVKSCEEKYGYEEVESVLDACHALMNYGVDKYKKPSKLSPKEEKERLMKKIEDDRILLDDIWRTLPKNDEEKERIERFPNQPEENILYFIEKNSPLLKNWQRELVRIVRKVSQYFYPQGQTKVTNEGFACISHYEIINKMYEEGYLDDGFMTEFYHHHSNVIYQPDFDSKHFSGINPYTLGFNIFSDIKRMSLNPTKEDELWFPDIAGKGDWKEKILYIVENFKDETFILQYLSPKVIRDMKFFEIEDLEENKHYEITSIHDEQGYKNIRKSLSENYNRSRYVPDIQIYDVDIFGDRTLTLDYTPINNKDLNLYEINVVLQHIKNLWGFPVRIIEGGDDLNLIYRVD